jgi:hypothetical protein
MAWRTSLRRIPASARTYARGSTLAHTGRGTPAPLRLGRPGRQRRLEAGVTESPGRSGVPARRGVRPQSTGGRVGSTHSPIGSSPAERLRLCRAHNSAIASRHPHAVDAAAATVAKGWPARRRRCDRSDGARARPSRCDPAAGFHSDHAGGQGVTIASGRRSGRCCREARAHADAAGLERLGLCIVGLKQPSASRGETTEAVAERSSSRRLA